MNLKYFKHLPKMTQSLKIVSKIFPQIRTDRMSEYRGKKSSPTQCHKNHRKLACTIFRILKLHFRYCEMKTIHFVGQQLIWRKLFSPDWHPSESSNFVTTLTIILAYEEIFFLSFWHEKVKIYKTKKFSLFSMPRTREPVEGGGKKKFFSNFFS